MNDPTPHDPSPNQGADLQERLRKSEERFALVLQATNEGFWVVGRALGAPSP